jgi:hypothetical protein
MMIPVSIAKKLLLLLQGEAVPASALRHPLITEMVDEDVLVRQVAGRTSARYLLPIPQRLHNFLATRCNVQDIHAYVHALTTSAHTKAQLAISTGSSKARRRRSFSGFLVNSYLPIPATLAGLPITIAPTQGTYTFIAQHQSFIPAPHVLIVGVENAECFHAIRQLQPWLGAQQALFVSRYPTNQSQDLIAWLSSIPNPYLHFGDFDHAGVGIFLAEFHRHLKQRATFFVPPGIDALIARHGSTSLYDAQRQLSTSHLPAYLQQLLAIFNKYKKGLEQEVLLLITPAHIQSGTALL